jgi:hypothetical protein
MECTWSVPPRLTGRTMSTCAASRWSPLPSLASGSRYLWAGGLGPSWRRQPPLAESGAIGIHDRSVSEKGWLSRGARAIRSLRTFRSVSIRFHGACRARVPPRFVPERGQGSFTPEVVVRREGVLRGFPRPKARGGFQRNVPSASLAAANARRTCARADRACCGGSWKLDRGLWSRTAASPGCMRATKRTRPDVTVLEGVGEGGRIGPVHRGCGDRCERRKPDGASRPSAATGTPRNDALARSALGFLALNRRQIAA